MEKNKQIQPGGDAQIMTSLQIAEATGKMHKDVLKAIRTMEPAWEKINGRRFAPVDYVDAKGEHRPCYALTKTECLYVATKFDDEARARLVLRWEQLEIEKQNGGFAVPQSFREALLLAASQQETIEKQEKQIARLAPKAALMERVLDSDQKIDIGQAAKILQLPFGRNKLFAQLRERGIFFTGRNEPKQTYIERGYFELREKWIDRDNHDGFAVIKVLVTQRGLDFLARLFNVTQSNPELAEVI